MKEHRALEHPGNSMFRQRENQGHIISGVGSHCQGAWTLPAGPLNDVRQDRNTMGSELERAHEEAL